MTGGRDLESLLDGRPELVPALDRLLDVDRTHEAWRPDDAGVDPGVVTSLVRRGYAEETGDGYRLTDRSVIRAAVDRHRPEADDRRRVGARAALGVALALVAAVRLLPVRSVFRDGWVVLLSNDPYFYRYLVDRALAGGPIPSLPPVALHGEPLLVATLSTATALLGGSTWASGVVLAWYPVVAAVLTGLFVYGIAVRLTDDARVGLVAVGLLAVTPANAYRTAIGSADHHAFDYVWLALTALAVVELLARDARRDRYTWAVAGVLAVAVAGQALAWEAGPLLLAPFAPALALVAVVEARRGSPARLGPVVAGLVGGAGLVTAVHAALGWQSSAVVHAVDLLALGGVGLLALALAVRRAEGDWRWLAGSEAGLAALAVLAVRATPDVSVDLLRGLDFLRGSGAAEMAAIGSTYGVYGPLLILGFAPVLAAPALLWAVRRGWRRSEPGWFVIGVYAVSFAALSAVQRRFGGELAPFAAVLGGVAFVWFASWLDLVRPLAPLPGDGASADDDLVVPDRTRLALLGGLAGVAVGSGALYTKFIDDLIVIDESSYRAARWIHDYSEANDLTYPENYVLSKWGRNRMYNYFVNGEAKSYAYARRHYEEFLFATDAEHWYETLRGRVGFVVTRDLPQVGLISPSAMQSCLHDRFGSADGSNGPGVGHYRAVFATAGGARKVFRLVPGATVRGRSGADRVRLSTSVSIPNADFEYVRRAAVDGGAFAVTVAHPGRYAVGDATVTVPERAVREGETVTVDPG